LTYSGESFKTIGILGGMGPYASSAFLRKILDKTAVENDRDHIHIVLDSHPHIPSRTRHVLYGEESPVPKMVETCRKLENYPVDAVAIPCNSAAAWIEDIRREISVPLLNIIEITVDSLERNRLEERNEVAVWGGLVTYRKETYRRCLEEKGYAYVQHPEAMQRNIENFIETIKLNRISDELIRDINHLGKIFEQDLGAKFIIMGCTEFGCIDDSSYTFHSVNSLDVYAEYIVRYARGGNIPCCDG
jgi:aspartate racemase